MIDTMLHSQRLTSKRSTPDEIVRRVLSALNGRDLSEALGHFSGRFTFADHALDLSFTDRKGLTDFFQKTLELLPDSLLDIESTSVCGTQVVARWKLSATKVFDLGGVFRQRARIFVEGVSVVRVIDEAVVSWSDYYDATRSWRFSLAGMLTEY